MATALINNCTEKPKDSAVFACITTHQGTVSRSGKLIAGRTEDEGRRKRAREVIMKTRQCTRTRSGGGGDTKPLQFLGVEHLAVARMRPTEQTYHFFCFRCAVQGPRAASTLGWLSVDVVSVPTCTQGTAAPAQFAWVLSYNPLNDGSSNDFPSIVSVYESPSRVTPQFDV